MRHPRIEQAVVAAREDGPGETRLCAYVVLSKHPPAPGTRADRIRKAPPRGAGAGDAIHPDPNRSAGVIRDAGANPPGLSREEEIRYGRQMLLKQWGASSQEKLKGVTAFAAGAGGSGSALIMQLALVGFGVIRVCDFDAVELSNLNRQCLHDESRIGVNKAELIPGTGSFRSLEELRIEKDPDCPLCRRGRLLQARPPASPARSAAPADPDPGAMDR